MAGGGGGGGVDRGKMCVCVCVCRWAGVGLKLFLYSDKRADKETHQPAKHLWTQLGLKLVLYNNKRANKFCIVRKRASKETSKEANQPNIDQPNYLRHHCRNKSGLFVASSWYNRTGWLGVKHQLTYLPCLWPFR